MTSPRLGLTFAPLSVWRLLPALLLAVALLSLGFGITSTRTDAAGDAGKIVFSRGDGIYVVAVDGSQLQRIWAAPPGKQGVAPQWSPDGSRMAFEGPDGNIWVMNADGGSVHAVNTQATAASGCGSDVCATPGTVSDSVRWSPDGAQVSYRLAENLAQASLWVAPVSGGAAPHEVASAHDMCLFNEGWSPDNTPLFSRCATASSPSNATYAAIAAPNARPFVAGSQLAYSADRAHIAFSSHALLNGVLSVGLYAANADGSGARLIAENGQNPAWSAGGLLAYRVGGTDGWTMHVYDPAGGHDTAVGSGVATGWSRDGAWLLYTTVGNGGPEIWRVHADGSAAQFVTAGDFPDGGG